MTYQEMYNKAQQDKKLENLTPKYFDFNTPDDFVIGKYISRIDVQSSLSKGTYYQYLFSTDEGLVKFHMGRSMDSEAGQLFQIGGIYSIFYLGQEKIGGGRAVNKFQIDCIQKSSEPSSVF